MRRLPTSFEASVSAFRDLTAAPADGAATRTRVLARAGGRAARRVNLRRSMLALAAALLALSSTSAAWTTGIRWWRGQAPVVLEMTSLSGSKPAVGGRPLRVIPFATDESDLAPDSGSAGDDGEARAYGRAHRAHFVDDAPAPALAAWDDYLEAYTRGVFAPEARYNRALCLVRLGRLGEAARALRSFSRASADGYRRTEAGLLLDWLHERLGAERASANLSDSR
jgi:hypothetical protein